MDCSAVRVVSKRCFLRDALLKFTSVIRTAIDQKVVLGREGDNHVRLAIRRPQPQCMHVNARYPQPAGLKLCFTVLSIAKDGFYSSQIILYVWLVIKMTEY